MQTSILRVNNYLFDNFSIIEKSKFLLYFIPTHSENTEEISSEILNFVLSPISLEIITELLLLRHSRTLGN